MSECEVAVVMGGNGVAADGSAAAALVATDNHVTEGKKLYKKTSCQAAFGAQGAARLVSSPVVLIVRFDRRWHAQLL